MVSDRNLPTELSVQKYKSGPPPGTMGSSSSPDGMQIQVSSDGETLTANKQEEWVTKRKTELVTTKQIETRVKRQVVLEDGKVVEDSGPLVTTTTTEDTDKNESEHTEHKQQGEDQDIGDGWVAIDTTVPEDAIVKETNERKVTTHDEVEDILETEEVQHFGDMTSQNLVRAIREGSDTRRVLLTRDKRELTPVSSSDKDSGQKRIVQQSKRHDRTTDIEDTKEVSKVNDIGNLVTEITRRLEHEEFHNEDIPDSDSDEFEHVENRDGSHDYSHAKSQDYIEYLAVPKGGNLSSGVKVAEGPRIVSENINSQRQGDDDLWDSVSERIRKLPKGETLFSQNNRVNQLVSGRSDALTSRPLDFSQEEHTRKHETNRWLNSHFGSSSSSLSSEASPRSPINTTPDGIHVTMTSTGSPLNSPAPPPPPIPGTKYFPNGKRITFSDSPSPRANPVQKDVHFDLKNRQEDVMRSLNSQYGQHTSTFTKSGSLWDDEPTPTPPPRSRRSNRNSPESRHGLSPDHNEIIHHPTNNSMYQPYSRKYSSSPPEGISSTYNLQKTNDIGERKGYERREQSFGYSGPSRRDGLDSYANSDYVTKHSNYYKTDETNNPAQNAYYENGKADVTERKSVERREKTFSYDGPSQKQFHPKYILGTPATTVGRLKGIEGTGAIIEEDQSLQSNRHSQTLPRRQFYFGDDEGVLRKPKQITSGRTERRFGTDDINVSILNKYNSSNHSGGHEPRRVGGGGLNRSMSFTPKTLTPLERSYNTLQQSTSYLQNTQKYNQANKSNPNLADSPDLLSPRLISNMSRSVRDVNRNEMTNGHHVYSTSKQESAARSRQTFLDSIKKNSPELYDPIIQRTKTSSPVRTSTPTKSIRSTSSPRPFGGNSPISDDFQETHRMTSNTPDHDGSKPKISTDTTSKFSRKTIRGVDGQPAGKVESSETTTRTKSRYKESEVMYPNGRRVASPSSNLRTDFSPQRTNEGSVIIPVRDNIKSVRYAS